MRQKVLWASFYFQSTLDTPIHVYRTWKLILEEQFLLEWFSPLLVACILLPGC